MTDELKPNTIISHYQIVSQIGSGGMGEVYRAIDTRLNREVAIKVLPSDFAKDEDRLQRFEQEAKATSGTQSTKEVWEYRAMDRRSTGSRERNRLKV